ncbi:Starch-binding associating with outer membrane [Fodinibius salinus]|uniref:Starch-binding associating with outer membrane n=1 Tax=Fodinibius salinus TaxID=860790 RepID=A0A5D3YLJ6_9BACT|nr:RagB/SusD family nutrient uptake outer membrane protein [Fodinibius salinus]TYP92768.1 Starch-binding associating with outer membrane [Fodinibius salinus]
MKNLNRLLLFSFILAFTFASCDSVTDIQQPGNLPADQAFEKVEDLELSLSGLYANVDIYDQVYINSVRTDEITIGPGNGGQGLGGQYQFVLNTTSATSTVWTSGYSSIDEINRFINGAQNVQPKSSQQAAYDDYLGQAYAMRAFEHFKLLSFYSEDITDNSSLGVIVSTEVQDQDVKPTRNTTGETFSQILDDIQSAENLINNASASGGDITRFTPAALTALKARIATYRKNYARAESLATEVINNSGISLATGTVSGGNLTGTYSPMFGSDSPGEVIFKLERTLADPYDQQANVGTPAGSGYIGNVYAQVAFYSGAHYTVEAALANLYSAGDIRFYTNLFSNANLPASVQADEPHDFVYKYSGNVSGEDTPLLNDQKVFRLSEMYLIRAEARAGKSSPDLNGAAQDIQTIRAERSLSNSAPLPSYANQQQAFADILTERRKELAFEGHRWFDLRRMGPTANAEIDRDETVTGIRGCSNYSACDGPVPGQSHKYVLPIPQSELNANPNIQQNPGYGGGS